MAVSTRASSTRIVILSVQHPARNPRVVKEADTLASAGYQVKVLTIASHFPSLDTDDELRRKGSWELNYAANLTRRSPSAFWQRLQSLLARKIIRKTGWEFPASLGAVKSLLYKARACQADLFIAHTEGGIWAGTHLLSEGRRVAVDYEDFHSEDLLPQDRCHRPLHTLQKIEKKGLHQAIYCSTTSHSLSAALHAKYGGQIPIVITNSFPLGPRHPYQKDDQSDRPIRLLWFSQTIGPGRGLETFLKIWNKTKTFSTLTLVGSSDSHYQNHLCELLHPDKKLHLNFVDPLPPEHLPAFIAQHDVGLALECRTIPNRDLTITNKILQYLNAGIAVIATPTKGQREVFQNYPDVGIMLHEDENTQSNAVLIDDFLSNRGQLQHMQNAARKAAEQTYCWEVESSRFLRAVEKALRA